jgi:N-acylneuraminate cytidylyltransferase
VSTDDAEIAQVAREHGAEVPFLRPRELAQDDTPDLPVFRHALMWFDEHEAWQPELVVHLRPTSPLRRPDDIDRAVAMLDEHADADSVRAVAEPLENPYVDIDTETSLELVEWMIRNRRVPWIPAPRLPHRPKALVLDFDGVLTDNRVWVDESGTETVGFDRGDGMGIEQLRATGVELLVLSTERNPVVSARCHKLCIPVEQGLADKRGALVRWASEKGIDLADVAYVGNDVNDLGCLEIVGIAVAVSDSHPDVLRAAHVTLSRPGGHGAVREICDMIRSAGA